MTIDDAFKVARRHELNGEDNLALARMYLPLIGPDALSFYLYLFTLSRHETHDVRVTLDALSFDSLSRLEAARFRLEGLGLLKSYQSADKGWILYLQTPLSTTSFLENDLLSVALEGAIGTAEVERLKEKEKTFRTTGYTEVTKSFDDVYDLANRDAATRIVKREKRDAIRVENPSFNYHLFKYTIDSSFIPESLLDDEEFQKKIVEIAYTYSLTEDDMHDVLIRTRDIARDLGYDDITRQAKRYYQEKSALVRPASPAKTESESPVSSPLPSGNLQDLVAALDAYTPEALLKSMNGDQAASVSELADMQRLRETTTLSQGMINALYLMVNRERNGDIPSFNYMQKIANDWMRKGLSSTADVVSYLTSGPAKTRTGAKKAVATPDWFKDYTPVHTGTAPVMTDEEVKNILAETQAEEEKKEK